MGLVGLFSLVFIPPDQRPVTCGAFFVRILFRCAAFNLQIFAPLHSIIRFFVPRAPLLVALLVRPKLCVLVPHVAKQALYLVVEKVALPRELVVLVNNNL